MIDQNVFVDRIQSHLIDVEIGSDTKDLGGRMVDRFRTECSMASFDLVHIETSGDEEYRFRQSMNYKRYLRKELHFVDDLFRIGVDHKELAVRCAPEDEILA